MKRSLTQSMAWLHTWGGLLFGWILFPVVLTGTVAVFHEDIDRWMQPEIGALQTLPAASAAAGAEAVLRRFADGADRWSIDLPERDRSLAAVSWAVGSTSQTRVVDASTGAVLSPRDTAGGHFIVEVHYSLHAGTVGMWIVGAAGLLMLVAIVSGVIIHKRIVEDFFTFRPYATAHRSWLDAHNASSVLTLPFQVMIAFTGIAVFHTTFLPGGIHALYDGDQDAFHAERFAPPRREAAGSDAPLTLLSPLVAQAEHLFKGSALRLDVQHPGDRRALVTIYRRPDDRLTLLVDWVAFDGVSGDILSSQTRYLPSLATDGVLVGLHFVQFGGYGARLLYFLLGLASSGMVATGLVLFTIKRRAKYASTQGASALFFRIAEACNVATVAGLVVAMAAYLWSNRLIATDIDNRALWEIRIFFVVWLITLMHALTVSPRRGWCTQLAAAAVLLGGLPIVNGLTTSTALWRAISSGLWSIAGVDIVALGLGALLAWIAVALRRRYSWPSAAVAGTTGRDHVTATIVALTFAVTGWSLLRSRSLAGRHASGRFSSLVTSVAALGAAWPICSWSAGWSIGTTLWLAVLSVGALLVVGCAPFMGRPHDSK